MPLKVVTRPDTGTLWIVGTVKPAGATKGRRVRQRAGSDDPKLATDEAFSQVSHLRWRRLPGHCAENRA